MKSMCLFKKNKRIDWPYLVFGLIAFGIVISTVVLLTDLKMKIGSGQKRGIDWSAQKVEQEKQISTDYLKSLSALRIKVATTKDVGVGLKLTEEVFFTVRVPQQFLDQHLKTWLAISRISNLEVGVQTETLLKLLDQLIEEIKK